MSSPSGVWVKTLISIWSRKSAYFQMWRPVQCTVQVYTVPCSDSSNVQSVSVWASVNTSTDLAWPGASDSRPEIRIETDREQTIEVIEVTQIEKRCSPGWQRPQLSPASDLFPWHTDLQSYPHENSGRVTLSSSQLSVCCLLHSLSCQNILVKLCPWWHRDDRPHTSVGWPQPVTVIWSHFAIPEKCKTKEIFVTLNFEKVRASSWNTLPERFYFSLTLSSSSVARQTQPLRRTLCIPFW